MGAVLKELRPSRGEPLLLDEELVPLWDAPVHIPSLRWGRDPRARRAVSRSSVANEAVRPRQSRTIYDVGNEIIGMLA
jgi:hypothetical protein